MGEGEEIGSVARLIIILLVLLVLISFVALAMVLRGGPLLDSVFGSPELLILVILLLLLLRTVRRLRQRFAGNPAEGAGG
jgi:hypothetical protein